MTVKLNKEKRMSTRVLSPKTVKEIYVLTETFTQRVSECKFIHTTVYSFSLLYIEIRFAFLYIENHFRRYSVLAR
jgi:hypothetical protein